MAIYWFLFVYFAIGAIIAESLRGGRDKKPSVLFAVGIIITAAVIGLRYEVGGDWLTYQFMYERAGPLDFFETLSIGDPAYQAINWLAYQLHAQIWFVNLVCGAIFAWGLYRFCRTQPAPWLAALIAIPYMVIVIAMGYTRQAVALGILMGGIAVFLRGGSLLRFGAYVVLAALFHKTAVVAFPIVALAIERNKLVTAFIVLAAIPLLYDLFLGNAMDHFINNYIHASYSSQGAVIRIGMNILAVVIFWFARNRLQFSDLERRLWKNFALASLVALVMLMLIPSSTAVDRLSLYLIPLQIGILGRVPFIFKSRLSGTTTMVFYCFLIEFVWLNFAQFADKWVPYHFFPV